MERGGILQPWGDPPATPPHPGVSALYPPRGPHDVPRSLPWEVPFRDPRPALFCLAQSFSSPTAGALVMGSGSRGVPGAADFHPCKLPPLMELSRLRMYENILH